MSADERLTRVQHRAVAALLASRTIVEAAKVVGVGESTLRRWLASDAFRRAYRQAAREQADRASSALMAASLRAIEVLVECMETGSPATKTRAARAVLELTLKVSADDVAERLDDLEKEVELWAQRPTLHVV